MSTGNVLVRIDQIEIILMASSHAATRTPIRFSLLECQRCGPGRRRDGNAVSGQRSSVGAGQAGLSWPWDARTKIVGGGPPLIEVLSRLPEGAAIFEYRLYAAGQCEAVGVQKIGQATRKHDAAPGSVLPARHRAETEHAFRSHSLHGHRHALYPSCYARRTPMRRGSPSASRLSQRGGGGFRQHLRE